MRGLRVGLVGWRAKAFLSGLTVAGATVAAVCELDPDRRLALGEAAGVSPRDRFHRYEDLLAAGLDAVVLGTPMPLHAPQAVAALDAGLHVLSEVTAAVTLGQCRDLGRAALAAARGGRVYMLAENYCYSRQNVLVRELVRRGAFGGVYYAEGEYLHDVKDMHHHADGTPTWRYHWQVGRNGCTYGTHSLGPAMQWLTAAGDGGADAVARVACHGSGRHTDPEHAMEDTVILLCKLTSGRLVRVRLDMLSNRPHAPTNYALQGTAGAYESARAEGETDRVFFCTDEGAGRGWEPLEAYASALPAWYTAGLALSAGSGHGGADFFVAGDFVRACRGEIPVPIGIEDALNWTAAGLVSQESIARGGMPLPVPSLSALLGGADLSARPAVVLDPDAAGVPQLVMRAPVAAWSGAAVELPADCSLREARDADAPELARCLSAAFGGGWDAERVRRDLLTATDVMATFVVTMPAKGTERIVATASDRDVPDRFPGAGYLHWVAVDPAASGRHLGAAVSIAAIAHSQAAGPRDMVLETDDYRLPAVATYLALGFTPEYRDPSHPARWAAVFRALAAGRSKRDPGRHGRIQWPT